LNLREEIEADLAESMEDFDGGFGWPIVITDPSGFSASLIGLSNDVSFVIDPDTGVPVSGRIASVALRISSLVGAGFVALPAGISDSATKPWLVTFDDISGQPWTFKIQKSNPDRAMGIITCLLELYE